MKRMRSDMRFAGSEDRNVGQYPRQRVEMLPTFSHVYTKGDVYMKKNNGGFSLLEFIVIVAVIAVLLGVLTPHYIRYLERSRIRHDDSIVTDIRDAANKLILEQKYFETVTGDVTVYINNQGVVSQISGIGVGASTVGQEFLDEINITVYGTATPSGGFTSKSYGTATNVYINLHYDATLYTFVPQYYNFPENSVYY